MTTEKKIHESQDAKVKARAKKVVASRSIKPSTLSLINQLKLEINSGPQRRKIQDSEIIAAGVMKLDHHDIKRLKDGLLTAEERLKLLFTDRRLKDQSLTYDAFLNQLLMPHLTSTHQETDRPLVTSKTVKRKKQEGQARSNRPSREPETEVENRAEL